MRAPVFPRVRASVHPDDGAFCPVCGEDSLRAHPALPISMCINDWCVSCSASFRHETYDLKHAHFINLFDCAIDKEAFLDSVPEYNAGFRGEA